MQLLSIADSNNPFGRMEESQEEDIIKKPLRERPKSALISKLEINDFIIEKTLR